MLAIEIVPSSSPSNTPVPTPSPSPTGRGRAPTSYLQEFKEAICKKLQGCFKVTESECGQAIDQTKTIDTEVGLRGGRFATYFDAELGEFQWQITANGSDGYQCIIDITELTCSDPKVQDAFDPGAKDPYANIAVIFPTGPGSCSQVFAE